MYAYRSWLLQFLRSLLFLLFGCFYGWLFVAAVVETVFVSQFLLQKLFALIRSVVVGELFCWMAKHTLNFVYYFAHILQQKEILKIPKFSKTFGFLRFACYVLCVWRCNNQQTAGVTHDEYSAVFNSNWRKKNTFAAVEIKQFTNHKWF